LLRYPLAQCSIDGLVGRQSNLCRETHERDLVRALDHAAPSGYRRGTRQGQLRCGMGNSIGEKEADRFFNSQLAICHPAVFQTLRYQAIRVFIFLPGAHVGTVSIWCMGNLFASSAFFERWTYVECGAFRRQQEGEHALTTPPAYSGEIIQRGARHQQDGVDCVLAHELTGAILTRGALFPRNGSSLTFSRLQTRKRWRQRGGVGCFVSDLGRYKERVKDGSEACRHAARFKKLSPGKHQASRHKNDSPVIIGLSCRREFQHGSRVSVCRLRRMECYRRG